MWSLFNPIIASLALTNWAYGYSNPEPCTGNCYAHDPGFIRRSSDGVYFRFNTDSLVDIMKADSITGPWEIVGNVLPNGSIVDLSNDEGLWVNLDEILLRREQRKTNTKNPGSHGH